MAVASCAGLLFVALAYVGLNHEVSVDAPRGTEAPPPPPRPATPAPVIEVPATVPAINATAANAVSGKNECFKIPSFPVSGLEQELIRLYAITEEVMKEIGATYWPTDGTLLGMIRNGRIATDRDLDMQIHSTYAGCAKLLHSLREPFGRRADIKSFKVVNAKGSKRGKIGRYAMVRLFRKHGTFDTGVDFNCVYTDDAEGPTMHVHRGHLVKVPATVFPLGRCALYDRVVPCPRDPMAVLGLFAPRYDGCLVFPHCLGPPAVSVRDCLSPHPDVPLQSFVEDAKALDKCGYVNMLQHFQTEPTCPTVLAGTNRRCRKVDGGGELCFLQKFE